MEAAFIGFFVGKHCFCWKKGAEFGKFLLGGGAAFKFNCSKEIGVEFAFVGRGSGV